jgi:hypothetical protein
MKVFKNLAILIILSGCYADTAIIEYSQKKHMVELGDTINKALPILENMHRTVPANWLRSADQYYEGGKNYYIHYQRTGHTEDGVMTDDEFTPYVFADNKLVSIGWAVLGGPRSYGNAGVAANNARQRSQALMNLSNALLQPQPTYNYNPLGLNSTTRCVATNTGFNTIVRCY